jgi:hypothetical protein
MPIPIFYRFRQSFNLPARKAYAWCTDYAPGDHALMGEKDAGRKVERFTERTFILADAFHLGSGNQVVKRKLVQLYPETLFWTCTHLSGPAQHSQFLYQIVADSDDASHLEFTGLFLDYRSEDVTEADVDELTEKECAADAAAWELLAGAMERDFRKE